MPNIADKSDFESKTTGIQLNNNDAYNRTTYYSDPKDELTSSVEQLFKILLEYAGIKLSVTSFIEPLFEKLGQTILASAQIKRFDVKILPNELINDSQLSYLNPSVELSLLSIINLNIHSVCKQSLEQDRLHSANVQAGITVRRVKQELNLSLLRLVYQFYTVVHNAVEYTKIDESTKTGTNIFQQQQVESLSIYSKTNTTTNQIDDQINELVSKSFPLNLHSLNKDNLTYSERSCWKKLRELVAIHEIRPETKQVSTTSKQLKSNLQFINNPIRQGHRHVSSKSTPARSSVIDINSEALLLSGFGWLIIDEIDYAASLGSLKVDGCMGKIQGSISLSQKLRALQTNATNQKK